MIPYNGSVRVTSPQGMRNGSMHNGMDLVGIDKHILAPCSGVVLRSRIVASKTKTDAETALATTSAALDETKASLAASKASLDSYIAKYTALADKIKSAMGGSAIIKAALEKLGIEV